MTRSIRPELLDSLASEDARAVRSRADLRRVNAWMGNAALITQAARKIVPTTKRILELGAGDGTLVLKVVQQLPNTEREVVLLDQQDLLTHSMRVAFAQAGATVRIMRQDVLDWARHESGERFDLIVANLFLHHFHEDALRCIFHKCTQCGNAVIACEPRRSGLAVGLTKLLWIIGCNEVTQHDARVSVEAGFADAELSELWPASTGWKLQERAAGFASHLFVARRV